jgi:hypothetical protein
MPRFSGATTETVGFLGFFAAEAAAGGRATPTTNRAMSSVRAGLRVIAALVIGRDRARLRSWTVAGRTSGPWRIGA